MHRPRVEPGSLDHKSSALTTTLTEQPKVPYTPEFHILHMEHQEHPIIFAGTGVGYVISDYRRTKHAMSLKRLKTVPSRRVKGEFFPGPIDVWGPPPPLKITDKGVFQLTYF